MKEEEYCYVSDLTLLRSMKDILRNLNCFYEPNKTRRMSLAANIDLMIADVERRISDVGGLMISREQQTILCDIFENSEAPGKINISFDDASRSINVTYYDIDEEWFNELMAARVVEE